MRRFRFVGDTMDYGNSYETGYIYESSLKTHIKADSVGKSADKFPNDWEEVFDEPKPLHKDTDLWHFAGLAMVGYLSNSNPDVVRMDQEEIAEYCVNHAKELIKQLDKEGK